MTKHIMFSYQWNSEVLVSKIYHYLLQVQSIPIWMDKHGGMVECLSTSMAEGVENCCVFICFLTPEYQESLNCKKELTYASQLRKPIIPCLLGSENKTQKWKPTQWLGLTITDLLYLNFSDIDEINFTNKCQELLEKIQCIMGINPIDLSEELKFNIENDEEDFQILSSIILPPIIREGPQINNETKLINIKKYSNEGDSSIHLINQSSDIECNQDLYAKNQRFYNSFTLSRFIFHNTSEQSISILQLSAEYENLSNDSENQWISCEINTNLPNNTINIDPNKLVTCAITIKIILIDSPGVDNEHCFRAHHLLPQPLRLKINIEDTQMKHASLIIEQINRPLNLPTLEKLIEKFQIIPSNILGFVWADDCSIEIRYFALISSSTTDDPLIKFSFGCDLCSVRSPTWNKQYIQTLQKKAKIENKSQLIVHENVFDPFISCMALFNESFTLQAIQITIKTNTSLTIQTIPLSLHQIFNQYQMF